VESREKSAESRKQKAESREQRAESREQREQRGESREQGAESRGTIGESSPMLSALCSLVSAVGVEASARKAHDTHHQRIASHLGRGVKYCYKQSQIFARHDLQQQRGSAAVNKAAR
jgi:hypothetical protein